MDKAILITKRVVPMDSQSSNRGLLSFDLPSIIERMKRKPTWIAGELNARVLLKKKDKKVVITVLHEGTLIESFQANDSITFQIIEGSLMFRTRKESVTLKEGQRLTIHENIKYCLTTTEDSVILLTIATNALRQRRN